VAAAQLHSFVGWNRTEKLSVSVGTHKPSRHTVEEHAACFVVTMIKRVYSNTIAGRQGITPKVAPHTVRQAWVQEDATTLKIGWRVSQIAIPQDASSSSRFNNPAPEHFAHLAVGN
jgi:hypothetical protein